MANSNKKVQMPSNIRNKMMAATAMLLVSCIMVVSSTYAWFTLSTAPEVTGISTSVGANGNLEMALLNTETFGDMSKIKSGVGDSMAAQETTKANLTWGNLVDLQDASYGLSDIKLMPASVNINEDGNLASVLSLLKTPIYGKDGRVNVVEANTVSGVKGTSGWDAGNNTYGVRAVGVSSTVSAREIAYKGAKNAYTSALNNAHAGMTSAISANMMALIGLTGDSPVTQAQIDAAKAILTGADKDLDTVVTAYKQYAIAEAAANDDISDDEFDSGKAAIASATIDQLAAVAGADSISVGNTALSTLLPAGAETRLTAISTMKTNIADAKTTVDAAEVGTTTASVLKNSINSVVGTMPNATEAASTDPYYWEGGVIGEIANNIGTYVLVEVKVLSETKMIYGGAENTIGKLPANVTEKEFKGTAAANISDTYGYVIDFAFRTNAAGSNLLLQTDAANRVYNDGGAATQGSGSNVTFTYADGVDATSVNAAKLLSNIKLVFFDPEDGTVYANAKLDPVSDTEAKIVLDKEGNDILALTQNTATKVSVLVYLDGESIQNSDVANAAESGTLAMNLQFASSAQLIPMDNTALKTME